jgi:hypothetical protein
MTAAAGTACAQSDAGPLPPAQAALQRGILLDRDLLTDSGEFCIRAGNEVVRYRFDSKTRLQRGGEAVLVQLRPGDEIEVASEPIPDSPLRYARSIQVNAHAPAPRVVSRAPILAPGAPLPGAARRAIPALSTLPDALLARPTITLFGVIALLREGRLVLRTRDAGEQTILLRKDTRFLAGGDIAPSGDLKPNMRIFVRAGRDLFGRTEAYQVIWGGFLQPHAP